MALLKDILRVSRKYAESTWFLKFYFKSWDSLKKVLLEYWNDLLPQDLRYVATNYPERLREVIRKRGGRIE